MDLDRERERVGLTARDGLTARYPKFMSLKKEN